MLLNQENLRHLSNSLRQKNPDLFPRIFCSSCNILLFENLTPYQTKCGCLFCPDCANQLFSSTNPNPCPNGEDECTPLPLNINQLHSDLAKQRQVKDTIVHCPMEDCPYYDTINNFMTQHIYSCPIISCPRQCGWQGSFMHFQTIHNNLFNANCCPQLDDPCRLCCSSKNQNNSGPRFNRNSFVRHLKDHLIGQHCLRDCSTDKNNNDDLIHDFGCSDDLTKQTITTVFSSSSSSIIRKIKSKVCFSPFGFLCVEHEFLWNIRNYERLLQRAQQTINNNNNTRMFIFISSPPIYLCSHDPTYLFRFHIYLNRQEGVNAWQSMSISCEMMQGEWDDYLPPCEKRFKINLMWPHEQQQQLWSERIISIIIKSPFFEPRHFADLHLIDNYVKRGKLLFRLAYGL